MSVYTFDIESNGLLDEIDTIWCLVLQDIKTKEVFSFSDYDDELPSLQEGLKKLQNATALVGHNIISFDIPAVKIVTGLDLLDKKCYDTLIMSQTLRYKRNHRHGLKGWGEHLEDNKLDYNDWSKYTKEMLVYCIQDVELNTKVYEVLMDEFKALHKNNPLIAKGLECEHDTAKFNVMVREQGWNFDTVKANANLEKLQKLSDEIRKEIEPQLGTFTRWIDKEPKFPQYKKNGEYTLNTSKMLTQFYGEDIYPQDIHRHPKDKPFQRSEVLLATMGQIDLVKGWLESIGWKPDDWTVKRINGKWVRQSPKLTETSLKALDEKLGNNIGSKIGEFYTLRNRISTLEGFLKELKHGRLHGDMMTIGTPSFRARHKLIVNLPGVDSKYGREIRELLIADEGDVIVGADSSGNQLRALCHYVNNPEFTHEMVYGDQHQRNADNLGCPRPIAKNYLYGFLFGAGDAKLGEILTGKKNAKVGAKSREDFAKGIKGLAELKNGVDKAWGRRQLSQGAGWFFGLDGRPVFAPSEHSCINYLLQSAEGITCKAAISYQMQKIKEEGLRAKPRIFYHDESAWSVHPDDAKRVGEILQESFKEAPKWFGVECMDGGAPCIGGSYADVH